MGFARLHLQHKSHHITDSKIAETLLLSCISILHYWLEKFSLNALDKLQRPTNAHMIGPHNRVQ